MRRRMSTFSVQNGQRLNRRGTVLMAPEGQQPMATGRDMEEQSMNFTLAGPGPMDSQAANQPYVEPGYSDLNPAYDQPINTSCRETRHDTHPQ
jgi:aquaglyceroporin related protein